MAPSLGPFFLLTLLFLSTMLNQVIGTTGLIDVPSARMMQDGFSRHNKTRHS